MATVAGAEDRATPASAVGLASPVLVAIRLIPVTAEYPVIVVGQEFQVGAATPGDRAGAV